MDVNCCSRHKGKGQGDWFTWVGMNLIIHPLPSLKMALLISTVYWENVSLSELKKSSLTLFWALRLAWPILSPDPLSSPRPGKIRICLVPTPHFNSLFTALIICVPGPRCPSLVFCLFVSLFCFFFLMDLLLLEVERNKLSIHSRLPVLPNWLVFMGPLESPSSFVVKGIECALFGGICAQPEDEVKNCGSIGNKEGSNNFFKDLSNVGFE